MRIKTIIILLATVLSLNSIAFSEPSSDIKWLMNDSVSLLDWGLYKIKQHLQGKEINDSFNMDDGIINTYEIIPVVSYEYELNRIYINGTIFNYSDIENKKQAKYMCKETINMIKQFWLKLHPLESFFSHEGYAIKTRPKTINDEIKNITVIKASILPPRPSFNPVDKRTINCESPYKSDTILFQE
jgi:hypothetical protein